MDRDADRASLVYTEPYIIPEIINQLLKGKKELTLGNVNSSRDFTFVSDTAEAMLRAISERKVIGEILTIGSGTEITILDLAHKISKIAKKKIKIKYDESRERPYDVNRLECNNKKAKEILGWQPKIKMDKGLEISIKWAK